LPDLLITNADICDGARKPVFRGSIVVDHGIITDILPAGTGDLPEARETIDAAGKLVTPGFVDVHSHSDLTILVDPKGESKLRQGITTEVVGNCGFSAFPLRDAILDDERISHKSLGLDFTWGTAPEYFARLERAKPAFNLATFVGHRNVRGAVMGFADRPPDAGEMRKMEREIEEAVEAGALGFSTGLIYAPGMFATTEELIRLQGAATRKGGMYASHVRGEGDRLLDAAQEFMAVVRATGCAAQYSHLKASGPRNWGKAARVIAWIEEINAGGGRVRFDKYPYTASSTELASFLPRWVADGGRDAAMARLADPGKRKQVIRELREDYGDYDPWQAVLIVKAGAKNLEQWEGSRIRDVATALGTDAEEVFLEILRQSELTAYICNFTMSQEETDLALLHPLCMVCTDGESLSTRGVLAEGSPHPRSFGSFPKFFRDYVVERPLLALEDAVAKATSLPCDTFGFRGRGRIATGFHADLLVVDRRNLADRATYAEPRAYCTGIDTVIVNGVLTLRDGEFTGRRGGRVLRREAS
jgi:N-acyl-D-amino-acid deacylase